MRLNATAMMVFSLFLFSIIYQTLVAAAFLVTYNYKFTIKRTLFASPLINNQ